MEVKQRKGGKNPPPTGAKQPTGKDEKNHKNHQHEHGVSSSSKKAASFLARAQFWGGILFFTCILTYHVTSFYYTGNFKWRYDDVGLGPTLADTIHVKDRPQFIDLVFRAVGAPLRFIFSWLSTSSLPTIDGALDFPELRERVRVIRDDNGVPHIYANNSHDAYFAQGFVHAQDRLFQMEVNRLVSAGRVSELVGEPGLNTDRFIRTIGLHLAGARVWDELDAEMKEIIQAYSDGVNAFIRMGQFPIEFTLAGHTPTRWYPQNVTSFYRLMVWQLSAGWGLEITRTMLAVAVGEERAREWDLDYPKEHPPTLPLDLEKKLVIELLKKQKDGILDSEKPAPGINRKGGSNTWAVNGAHSATGKPLLASDPHLKQTVPSTWYFNHMIVPKDEINVWGASVPGIPSMAIGHNEHAAWGVTLSFVDVEDLFIDKLNENESEYEFKGSWRPLKQRQEVIHMKGKSEPHVETVRETHHGPILTTVVPPMANQSAFAGVSYASSILKSDVPAGIKGMFGLARMRNYKEFRETCSRISDISLNIVYADVHGDIAYHATGTAPKRLGHHTGINAVPGWTGEYDWTGEYIPPAEFPHGVNPDKGFVHSCNHKIISDDFPHYLGRTWMNGYRGRRIEELLAAKPKHSLKDFADYQHDVMSVPGKEFVAAVKHHIGAPSEARFKSLSEDVRTAARALFDWDLLVSSDSIGATVYEVARYFVVRNLAEPSLGADLADLLVGKGAVPLLKMDNEYFGYDTVSILRMLDPKATKQSWWLEQAGGANKLLINALSGTVAWLKRELGSDPKQWSWGRIHRWPFPHGLAEMKPLDQVFSLQSIPVGGDTDTLLQMAFAPEEPYDAKCWTPSTQLLYDVGNWSRSVWKFYPGNSGNLGSMHYNDFHKKLVADVKNEEPRIEVSAKKHYVRMWWTKEEVQDNKIAELVMEPN